MAGFIHIKDDNGFSVNSIAFNAIVEFSRKFFSEVEKKLVRDIYSPVDEGGMDMVSLDEENEDGFNTFYRGVKKAYDNCIISGKCGSLDPQYFTGVMSAWRELLELLEKDERFVKP